MYNGIQEKAIPLGENHNHFHILGRRSSSFGT